jgi:hypothetical protein
MQASQAGLAAQAQLSLPSGKTTSTSLLYFFSAAARAPLLRPDRHFGDARRRAGQEVTHQARPLLPSLHRKQR